MPHDLIDNAAIVGTVSLVTGALFLLDMGGPKGKKPSPTTMKAKQVSRPKPSEAKSISQQVYDIERELQQSERETFDSFDQGKGFKQMRGSGMRNGRAKKNGEVENGKNVKGEVNGTSCSIRKVRLRRKEYFWFV